jgi:hypothetical protein
MTIYDKTNNLQPVRMKNFFGGNVKAFADAKCPDCQSDYKLYLRQERNSWRVIAIEPVSVQDEGDSLSVDTMTRDELKVFLDSHGVSYTAQLGESKLRELARTVE